MNTARTKKWSALARLALCTGIAVTLNGQAADSVPAVAGPIVVQNYYFALPGKSEEVFEWRLHASEVRAKLGLSRGRVLRRIAAPNGQDSAVPDVIWECDYPSQAAREKDIALLSRSAEFDQVEKHMDKLLRKFDRALFERRD